MSIVENSRHYQEMIRREEILLLRIVQMISSTNKNTSWTLTIKIGRQDKKWRKKSETRKKLEGIIIRKRKVRENMLEGMVLRSQNYDDYDKEEIGMSGYRK